jgi:hypothetical protein
LDRGNSGTVIQDISEDISGTDCELRRFMHHLGKKEEALASELGLMSILVGAI